MSLFGRVSPRAVLRIASLLIGLSVGSGVTLAQPEAARNKCQRMEFPLEMLELAKLTVVSNTFSAGQWTYNNIVLRNDTGRTILRAMVVVDYLDSDGKVIFSIPFRGGYDDTPVPLSNLRAFVTTTWGHPIEPGKKLWLEGTNLKYTTVAPTAARVTLADTKFDDGSNAISVRNTRTNPLPLRSPQYFEMDTDIDKLPDEIWLSIQVDDRGRVGGVHFDDATKPSDSDARQIKAQLLLWRFFPATAGGFAVPEQLNLRLSFHEKEFPLPREACPLNLPEKAPRTFVPVVLQRTDSHLWQARYAGQYMHGDFDTIEARIVPPIR